MAEPCSYTAMTVVRFYHDAPLKFNMITQETLDLIQEECAEVIQIISKIRRFGIHGTYENKTNYQRLINELTDLDILLTNSELEFKIINNSEYRKEKLERLKTFTNLELDVG